LVDTATVEEDRLKKASTGEPNDRLENEESNYLELPAEDLGLDSID
jgi:hypothetical protein